MSADVFQPSQDPLVLRGAVTTGVEEPMDSYKKASPSVVQSRPSTNSGYRFGMLSHNSFFARHNPHPGRVRHIKGLLDVPICSVNDNGFLSNPRYAPQFPPNNYANNKLNKHGRAYNIPANSINVNNQLHPINTITGLQFFLGKPMNMRVFRERIDARNAGGGNDNDAWRDELKALTEALGLNAPQPPPPNSKKPETAGRPKTQYSETTGRLIPPASRAMSRGGTGRSRGGQQTAAVSATLASLGAGEPDTEDMVLGILAQILQTDDVGAVQQWLLGAGDREKAMVLEMIRQAMETKDASALQTDNSMVPADYSAPMPDQRYDDVIGDSDVNEKIDRLTLEPPTPVPRPRSQQNGRPRSQHNGRPKSQQNGRPNSVSNAEPATMRFTYTPQTKTNNYPIMEEARPVTSGAAFRPSRSATSQQRPMTSGQVRSRPSSRPATASSPAPFSSYPQPPSAPESLSSEAKMRFLCTPPDRHDIRSQKRAIRDVLSAGVQVDMGPNTWHPQMSAC